MLLFIRLGNAFNGDTGKETIERYIKFLEEKDETWFGTNLISTGFGKKRKIEFRERLDNKETVEIFFIISKTGGGNNTISYKAEMIDFVSNAYETEAPEEMLEPNEFKGVKGKIWLKLKHIERVEGIHTSNYYIESTHKRLDKLLSVSQNTFGYIKRYEGSGDMNCEDIIPINTYIKKLEEEIENSKQLNETDRMMRLARASKRPEEIKIVSKGYKRNSDVIAVVLERAKGICEVCGNEAPFIRKSDGTPYLEIHHVTPLSENGEDTVENAIAVCPNCHRKSHFG